jgi:hypothetical protein
MALIETEALRHSYRDGDALVWAVDGIGGISGVLQRSAFGGKADIPFCAAYVCL